MQHNAEQLAFLRQKAPLDYAPLRASVDELRVWLENEAGKSPADPIQAKRKLVGLEDPEGYTPLPQLVDTVHRSIESIRLDPANAAACFMLARAITELGRYDDETYHGQCLRDAVPFAERATQLAPRVGKAWRALIEIYIHLHRDEMVTEMLSDLDRDGFAPGTHATLSARYAEARGNYDEAIDWYERAMGYVAEPPRRAEAYAAQAFCFIKMKRKSEAERPFMMALLEGGPSPWIGHNWSILKFELGNLPGAIEMNRRVLEWDWNYPPANEFKNYLIDILQNRNMPYPGPIATQEEQLRGLALPGCDPTVRAQLGVAEWQPPKRGTRARATRTFRSGLE